jgi:hypothetical protein
MDCFLALSILLFAVAVMATLAAKGSNTNDNNNESYSKPIRRSSSGGIWLPLRERRRIRRFFKR